VDYARTPCSEFPNDNHDLHEGAAWYAADDDETGLEPIEIVDELVFDVAAGDEPEAIAVDPFLRLVGALESAATSAGGTVESVALLRAMLGMSRLEGIEAAPAVLDALMNGGLVSHSSTGLVRSERLTLQVLAWQDIVREKSEDFSACGGATLDEWSSDLVARTLGATSYSAAIRRELRKHGVAAFGLVAAA
jgi:hypothetical protein